MGDVFNDSEVSNLPPEAWGIDPDGPFDPDDFWISSTSSDEEKQIAMREWFLARFCDPVGNTPYIGREGGYLFIHGGPYDPADELHTRFENLVDESLIDAVVNDLHAEVGQQWAPIQRQFDSQQEYDERYGLGELGRGDPIALLSDRLRAVRQLVDAELVGPHELLRQLTYGAAIAAVESFLWRRRTTWSRAIRRRLRGS